MSTMGTRAISELLVDLDATSSIPLYQQLYERIRQLITSGLLAQGDKLPSIRALATSLNVSHITVERSYQQLVAEGYVDNIARMGHVVHALSIDYFASEMPDYSHEAATVVKIRQQQAFVSDSLKARQARYDFSFTRLFPGAFPAHTWKQIVDDVLHESTAPFESYAPDNGPSLAARELAGYLGIARGVSCDPEQVIVRAGTRDSLQTALQLIPGSVALLGHENPGYDGLIDLARSTGITLEPLPVTGTPQAYLDALERLRARVVFCTPSHQFPTGSVMPVSTRLALLQWAYDNGAYIIEDDACHEYRFDVPTIPSLYSLDRHQRVIYVGGFSKTLSPALRLSYLVLPWNLVRAYWNRSSYVPSTVSYLTQEVLGRFMAQGHWERHVRRMVSALKRRHDLLASHLTSTFGTALDLGGIHAGMHFYATVRNGMNRAQLLQSAYDQGVKVYDPSAYWHGCPAPQDQIIIGFSSIDPQLIAPGVAALGQAWLP